MRKQRRAHRNETVIARDFSEDASRLGKILDSKTDEASVLRIEELLKDYHLFSSRDVPVDQVLKDLQEYLKLKRRELQLLKKRNLSPRATSDNLPEHKQNGFLEERLRLDSSEVHIVINRIQSEIDKLKKTPKLKGRREDYYLKQLIEGLLLIWEHKRGSIQASKEVTAWIKAAVNTVTTVQSTPALSKIIQRIISKNNGLKKIK